MSRLQKHEREACKALHDLGFTTELRRTRKGHSDLFVTKGGVTHRIKVASSPANADAVPLHAVKAAQKAFSRKHPQ